MQTTHFAISVKAFARDEDKRSEEYQITVHQYGRPITRKEVMTLIYSLQDVPMSQQEYTERIARELEADVSTTTTPMSDGTCHCSVRQARTFAMDCVVPPTWDQLVHSGSGSIPTTPTAPVDDATQRGKSVTAPA